MKKYYCDRCGRAIGSEFEVFNVHIMDLVTGHKQLVAADADICGACARDIADYIKKEPSHGPELRQTKKRGRPSKCEDLDVGKIRALKEAGWTVKGIAEEMNRDINEILTVFHEIA